MQTRPDFDYLPRSPEPRVVVKQNWVGTIVAGGVALLVLVASGFLYFSVKSDLSRTEAELAAVEDTLDQREDELQSAENDLEVSRNQLSNTQGNLDETKEELASRERTLDDALGCSYRMLAAWFETTNYSYTVTGLALQRAVSSRACQVSRAAYQTADGPSTF